MAFRLRLESKVEDSLSCPYPFPDLHLGFARTERSRVAKFCAGPLDADGGIQLASIKFEAGLAGIANTVPVKSGAVAQLGEHLLCKQGVTGSIPVSSTRFRPRKGGGRLGL